MPAEPDGGPRGYTAEYAAAHGRFALVPAAYVFLLAASGDGGGERVLLQRRAGTGFYDGWWGASAAGHVDPGESAATAAAREAAEEIGVGIAASDLLPLTTLHRRAGSERPADQRVDFAFACRRWSGEPALQESTADALEWFALDALPDLVVHHERAVLEGFRDGTLAAITPFGF
ncbi:NUDIX domain-containing protein [Agromyces sp. SYSU T00194]|uniref:NUDIX domain-containing protein n=1 Tax=Agromyces chitinivorans TaxID=3158560 RepID=UPI0033947CD3